MSKKKGSILKSSYNNIINNKKGNKIWGIKCIVMENIKTHAKFNTNIKSITSALEIIQKY